ncbi:hypothetical protein [Paraflavitalea pollutisoli]|uniref:hypothetical protein n=1 Tax=Paraflavitalea pollutisoli TaxID=3034143 RepID=UPI0023EC106D|nr:hypothetical protein [Paraflavitalea sp. H1-2-19X]
MKKLFYATMLLLAIGSKSCTTGRMHHQPAAPYIAWDSTTRVKISSAGARYNGYARMVQLPGKTLLTIYDRRGV